MWLSSRIRWCSIDDITVVLDINRGSYFALDPETSRQWNLIAAGGGIAEDGCKVNERTVAAFRDRGWLCDGRESPLLSLGDGAIYRLARLNRYIFALVALLRVRTLISASGFSAAYDWAAAPHVCSSAPTNNIEVDLRRFMAVEALIPSPSADRDCLPRSLALYFYLSRLGHQVCHVIGIGRFPFDAHAWVEHAGAPLLDREARNRSPAGARTPRGRTPIARIG